MSKKKKTLKKLPSEDEMLLQNSIKEAKDLLSVRHEELILIDNILNGVTKTDTEKAKKKTTSIKNKSVDKWSLLDLSYYFSQKYKEKYNANYPLGGAAYRIKIISDTSAALSDHLFREVNKEIIKTYIDWFFANIVDEIRSKKSRLITLGYLSSINYIQRFSEVYRDVVSVKCEPIASQDILSTVGMSLEELDQTYMVGVSQLLLRYGIVTTYNYLIYRKDYATIYTDTLIQKSMESLRNKNKNLLVAVSEETRKRSPYPAMYKYPRLHEFVKQLTALNLTDISVIETNNQLYANR